MDKEDSERLIRIEESVKDLPDLIKKVESHDRAIWVLKGISGFFAAIAVIFTGGWLLDLIQRHK